MSDRVVRVAQPASIIRSNGTPAIVRTQANAARVVRVGVPGPQGERGERGLPGEVAGELPWASVTGKPNLATDEELEALRIQIQAAVMETDGGYF